MGAPETRASFAQGIQTEVRALPAAQRDAILHLCGAAWTHIEQQLATSWIDEPTYNALTGAVRTTLGDDETRALFRRLGRRGVKNPMMRASFEGLARVFGLSPQVMFKFAPRARDQLVRNSGTLVCERDGERGTLLTLRGFPPSTFSRGTTAILLAGSFHGLLDFCGVGDSGSVTVEELDLAGGSCRFRIRW